MSLFRPNPADKPSPDRAISGIFPAYGITLVGALVFAAWLYVHLGDFTAERGWRAALQVLGVSLAFGAMAHLIVEAAVRAVRGLQNDLDALNSGRERRSVSDDRT